MQANRNFGSILNEAEKHLANADPINAIKEANNALDMALWEMMEPIGSQYVNRAQEMRFKIYKAKRN